MTIPPESIVVGQCYLTTRGHVRRVIRILPGRVQFERRVNTTGANWAWAPGLAADRAFALSVERPVPCDWTAETDR
jgi:hypothetical protein